MTEILEAPIRPPAEEDMADEPAGASSSAGTTSSKATVRTKSTRDGSRASQGTSSVEAGTARPARKRASTPAKARTKTNGNGSVPAAQELESLSADAPVEEATTEVREVASQKKRASTPAKARTKTNGNGSVPAAQELESLSADVPAAEVKEVATPRKRSSTPAKARTKTNGNGSVPAAQELEALAVQGTEATTEPSTIEADGDEDLELNDQPEEHRQERRRLHAPNWGAVRGWVRSNLLLCAVAVALVVAVAFLTTSRLSLSSQDSLNTARTGALASAHGYAIDLASYNYKNLSQDFGKVLNESTPSFKQDFSQSSQDLSTALKRYDATATAKVVAEGLVSATTSRAVVMVFLNQTVENTLQKGKPSTTESRVEITLVRSGSRWLIQQVSLL